MDKQEQESLWKQAGELAHRMFIRKLSMRILREIPAQGNKFDIPHSDTISPSLESRLGKGDERH